jgi:uncharacterized membrane protein
MIIYILLLFLFLDGIYFYINLSFFSKTIYDVQKSPVKAKYIPVAFTYLLLVAIEYYFIIKQKKGLKDAFLLGAGIYGVYELTNYATLKEWPLSLVFMDTIWGGILFMSVTYLYNRLINL